MFGIGLGEILIVLLVVFLLAPRELPRVMRTIGKYVGTAERIRRDLTDVKRSVSDVAVEVSDMEDEREQRKAAHTVVPCEAVGVAVEPEARDVQ